MRTIPEYRIPNKRGFISRKWKGLSAAFLSLGLLAVFGINATTVSSSSDDSKINSETVSSQEMERRRLVDYYLGGSLRQNTFQGTVDIPLLGWPENLKVLYTMDFELQQEVIDILKQYASDYASVVALDPASGKILAMASYENGEPAKVNWATKANFPAASIFKIVTAAAAIEKYKLSPEMEMGYTGSNYKLYKRDLFNENERWARSMTFKQAFAKSINIFFGKLALKFMVADDLLTFANKFYFNRDLKSDFPVESGKAQVLSKDPYHVAEVASGFNSMNTLSPVHGAMIAGAVVNDGKMFSPFVVDSFVRADGSAFYKSSSIPLDSPITNQTAQQLRDLMTETVERGTSRKAFRELTHAKKYSIVEAGGKTGSLTGTNPQGKTDWFVGYARLGSRMLALSVVSVNRTNWKVKSSYVAQRLIKKYFKEDVILSTAQVGTDRTNAEMKN